MNTKQRNQATVPSFPAFSHDWFWKDFERWHTWTTWRSTYWSLAWLDRTILLTIHVWNLEFARLAIASLLIWFDRSAILSVVKEVNEFLQAFVQFICRLEERGLALENSLRIIFFILFDSPLTCRTVGSRLGQTFVSYSIDVKASWRTQPLVEHT